MFAASSALPSFFQFIFFHGKGLCHWTGPDCILQALMKMRAIKAMRAMVTITGGKF
jgi:hypothetical protein